MKHLDIDYFLGHCCFVVTQGKLIFTKNFCLRQKNRQALLSLCVDQLESSTSPPPGNPLRSNSCALGPKLCSNSHPSPGFNQKARSANLTNSCQPFLLSHLLSACESEFFYLKTPPYQKSKHIYSAGKTCQICFKLRTPVRQGSNSLPPQAWMTDK